MAGDNSPPSVADEMNKFGGFTVEDGETIDPKTEDLNPVEGKTVTKAEEKALADREADEQAAKAADEKAKEPEDKAKTPPVEKPAAKGKPSAEDRIRELTRARHDAERRASAAEAENDRLRNGGKPTPVEKPSTPDTKAASSEGRPKAEDFEYGALDENYIEALAGWKAEQALAKREEERDKTQAERQQNEAAEARKVEVDTFVGKADAAKYPDFKEVVYDRAMLPADDPESYPISATLGELILSSDVGHDIVYALASDRDEAFRIYGLSPARQAAWFGRREAELSSGSDAKPPPKVVPTTKAPTPLKTAARGASSNNSTEPLDFAAFERAAMGRS